MRNESVQTVFKPLIDSLDVYLEVSRSASKRKTRIRHTSHNSSTRNEASRSSKRRKCALIVAMQCQSPETRSEDASETAETQSSSSSAASIFTSSSSFSTAVPAFLPPFFAGDLRVFFFGLAPSSPPSWSSSVFFPRFLEAGVAPPAAALGVLGVLGVAVQSSVATSRTEALKRKRVHRAKRTYQRPPPPQHPHHRPRQQQQQPTWPSFCPTCWSPFSWC